MQIITRLRLPFQRGPSFLNYNAAMFKAVYPFSTGGYETLISQISQSTTPAEVLDQWKQNKSQFKNEHLILSLRMLGRYSKNLGMEMQQSDDSKQAYYQLTSKLDSALVEVSEFDLIDILFWLRKSRQNKILGQLSTETYNQIFRRVNDCVFKKVYSFRNLVNIYYDLAMLGRSTELLIEQMTLVIKKESSQVTPFIAVQILQAASKRTKTSTIKEWIMIDSLIRQLVPLLDEFDLDQKSSIFKYLSILEMNYHFPTYKVPSIQYTLRTEMMNKLESLSEFGVLNVVSGYQFLPIFFPQDLLEEIKDMVNVTLENTASNLKHAFLLDYTELITQIPKRKLDEKKLNNISSEIAKRIVSAELHSTHGNADKLARIFNRQAKSDELVNALYDMVSHLVTEFQNNQRPHSIPLVALEFLVLAKKDITELLQRIQSVQVDKLSPNSKLRLYGILASQKDEQFAQLHQTLYLSLLEKAETQPESVLVGQENLYLPNRDELKALNQKVIIKLRDQITPENLNKNIKAIYLSIQDNESRTFWTEWISTIELTRPNLFKFMEDFELDQTSYNNDNIRFFLDVISLHPEELHVSRLLSVFQNNQKLTSDIARNDNFLRKICDLVRTVKEAKPQEVRLLDVLQLVMRLESSGTRSDQFRSILKKCYELNKKAREGQEVLPHHQTLDAPYLTYMIKYKCLSEQEALSLSERALKMNDIYFKSKILGLAQQAEGGEKLNDSIQDIANELSERLDSQKLSTQLLAIPALICLHPKSYTSHADKILKLITNNSAKINDKLYIQILQAIPRKWMQQFEERQIIFPILKELIEQYTVHSKRANFGDLLLAMETFVNLQVKNTPLFNNFLNDVGRNFSTMTTDQRIRSLRVFSQAQIRQLDFFQKTLEKINENPKYYKFHLGDISNYLFKVGVNDELCTEEYQKFLSHCSEKASVTDLVSVVQLLCIQTDDIAAISNHVQRLKDLKITSDNKYVTIVQAAEYLSRKNGSHEKLRNLISPSDYEKTLKSILGSNQKFVTSTLIVQLLTAMGVDHQVKAKFDDLTVDILIPSQKIIISLIKPSHLNHDNQTFSGSAILRKKIFETIADHTVIQFSVKDLDQNARSSIDKVFKILYIKGIKSNKQGNYDLSEIIEKPKPVKKYPKKEEANSDSEDVDEPSETKKR